MRKIFSLLLIAAFVLQSCQKDTKDKLPEETDQGTISSENPAQMSAAIKVWHGQRTTGTMPVPNSSEPEIDPTANPQVRAFAGRYAIIKPEVISGTVAGYYVGIPGAGQYFKVDYTKPRDIAGRSLPGKNKDRSTASIAGRLFGIQDGTADSSIVIVLPTNIQVPDTFCVTYYPFDVSGNIGSGVTTCIIVSALGSDANSAWLQNSWNVTASWDLVNGQVASADTIIFNKWATISGASQYACFPSPSGDYLDYTSAGGPSVVVEDSIRFRKLNRRFATNGAIDSEYQLDLKFVIGLSLCTSPQFFEVSESGFDTGGWSYNPITGKLIIIMEFDQNGVPEPEVFLFDLVKVNNNHFILIDHSDPAYVNYTRFER